MKIKALTSFAGKVSMIEDEVREVADELGRDLIRAGHAVEIKIKKETPVKPVEKPVEKPRQTRVRTVEKRKR